VEQWVIAALGVWVMWAEVRAVFAERRHAAERRELCARLQAGTIERYDAHTARVSALRLTAGGQVGTRHSEKRPRTPAAPEAMPLPAESVAEARLEFDRLMGDEGPATVVERERV
jgi:hypothetical protein